MLQKIIGVQIISVIVVRREFILKINFFSDFFIGVIVTEGCEIHCVFVITVSDLSIVKPITLLCHNFKKLFFGCAPHKRITDIRFKIKRLTEKIFDSFGTFSIQKNGCRNYHFCSPFKTIQIAGNRINI